VGIVTGAGRRRTSSHRRAVFAAAGVAVLTLVALVAPLHRSANSGHGSGAPKSTHGTSEAVAHDRHHAVAAVHVFHQQASIRARGGALAVLAALVAVAPSTSRRLRLMRVRRAREFGTVGLPPARAPPAIRIA